MDHSRHLLITDHLSLYYLSLITRVYIIFDSFLISRNKQLLNSKKLNIGKKEIEERQNNLIIKTLSNSKPWKVKNKENKEAKNNELNKDLKKELKRNEQNKPKLFFSFKR